MEEIRRAGVEWWEWTRVKTVRNFSKKKERNGEAVKVERGRDGGGNFEGGGASSIRISAAPQWGEGGWGEKGKEGGEDESWGWEGRVRMKNCHSLHSLHYTGTKHDGRYLT